MNLARNGMFAALAGCTSTSTSCAAPVIDDGALVLDIAHMVNTTDAVNWAVASGANAVELDLRFEPDGQLAEFRHGAPCDCTCLCPLGGCGLWASGTVCEQLEAAAGDTCGASSEAGPMLRHLAKTAGLAGVFVDSKVGERDLPVASQAAAGTALIQALDSELFSGGYPGFVVVSAPSANEIDYLAAAARQSAESPFRSQVYFAIDGAGSDAVGALAALVEGVDSRNRAHGAGISACVPWSFEDAIRTGAANQTAGVTGLTYAWTVDDRALAGSYLAAGATGIMTNRPAEIAELLLDSGGRLAVPGDQPSPATSDAVVDSTP